MERIYRRLARAPMAERFLLPSVPLTPTSRLSIADESRASIKRAKGAGIMLALEVEDVHAAHRRAGQEGLQPTATGNHPWGAEVFNLFDPEGHRIEIWRG